LSLLQEKKELLTRKNRILIKWQKLTKHSRTLNSNLKWQEILSLQEILVLRHTLMPVKRPQQKEFYFIPVKTTKWGKLMKVVLQQTGWSRKLKEVLPLLLQQ